MVYTGAIKNFDKDFLTALLQKADKWIDLDIDVEHPLTAEHAINQAAEIIAQMYYVVQEYAKTVQPK